MNCNIFYGPKRVNTLYVFTPILRELEQDFWARIARLLNDEYTTYLVISGLAVRYFDWKAEDRVLLLPLKNHYICGAFQREAKSFIDLELLQRIRNQAGLWDEQYSEEDIRSDAAGLTLHLTVLQPDALLIWNWHRPEGLLAKTIAESMGIQCWDIERTPWPGMLTLDRHGQLSETDLSASLRSFSEKYPDQGSPLDIRLLTYIDRADEYIATMKSHACTWWQQPPSGIPEATRSSQHADYENARYRILFAGQVDNDVQNFLFSPRYQSNIDAFAAFLNALPAGCFVIGKHHPMSSNAASVYQDMLDKAEHVTGIWTQDLDVESSLALVDHVIAVNSSFLFEALCHGKSCFELGQTMLSGLNVFYDCMHNADLESSIIDWISSPLSDCMKRAERFRVLTGFALSHGLLSFNSLPFTFEGPDCETYIRRWLNRHSSIQAKQSMELPSGGQPLNLDVSANAFAVLGLVNFAYAEEMLRQGFKAEKAIGVKNAAFALLANLRISIGARIRNFANQYLQPQ